MVSLTVLTQPPVHSPLSLASLVRAGAVSAFTSAAAAERKLRQILIEKFAASDILLTASGTEALQLAMAFATRKSKSARPLVALPGYVCFDVATAAVAAGVSVTLYDLDPANLMPDMDSLSRAIADGAEAVVICPLYGYPVDWDAVSELATANGTVLIEDAAQAAGATWRGMPVGSLGDVTVLSFGRGKGWTGGGGGALLARGPDPGLVSDIGIRTGGSSLAGASIWVKSCIQWALGRPGSYSIPAAMPWLGLGETHYSEPVTARQMPAICAALACETAELATGESTVREEHARWWTDAIHSVSASAGCEAIQIVPGGNGGYLRFAIRIAGGSSGLASSKKLRRAGVAAGYPSSLADLEPLARLLVGSAPRLPGSISLVEELVTLPTHRFVNRPLIGEVVSELASVSTTPNRSLSPG